MANKAWDCAECGASNRWEDECTTCGSPATWSVAVPLPREWYEVILPGSSIVVGHVEATWLGEAHALAEAAHGKGACCFVASTTKGLSPIGAAYWSGRQGIIHKPTGR